MKKILLVKIELEASHNEAALLSLTKAKKGRAHALLLPYLLQKKDYKLSIVENDVRRHYGRRAQAEMHYLDRYSFAPYITQENNNLLAPLAAFVVL